MQPAYNKYILLLLVCFSFGSISTAKDAPQYAVDKIPAELLKNANAVVRINEVKLNILSKNKANKEVKYAVTILKENAIDESFFAQGYDKYIKINDISGIIYDANGKRVKRIKTEDILDYSAIQGFSLYEDNRVKAIDPEYMTLPFTIEYSYSIDYKSLFFMPSWYVFPGYNISVEHSSYSVTTPNSYILRYNELNLSEKAEVRQSGEQKIYAWKHDNFKAINYEPFSPPSSISYPCVQTEPSTFNINNYDGDFSTWDDMGRFMCALNEDLDILPVETQNEIKELVKDVTDIHEKVALIYQYSQKKNRYISVQVGIGGWQPFPAETVDRLSYGDCKALSNYTKALLKVVGIESRYTLVYAGASKRPINPDFPGNNFNHAFLCVPFQQDTIWLECTSATSPCGYIGDFTDDRYVLLIEDNGGKLVKTPSYSAKVNSQSTIGEVQFTDNLLLDIDAKIKYSGANYGDEYYLLHIDEKDRRKKIIKDIRIPNFKLIDYQLADEKTSTPSLTKNMRLEASNYCTQMGNRTILKLNLFNAFNSVPQYARKRNNPVYIKRNYSESDTIKYALPADVEIEALPTKTVLSSKYGEYESFAENKDGHIIYHRYFQINKGTYPKEEFNDFREFLEKVSIADNAKTVLISKT
ncbi:DUF3857 domain-containing transglutaminase family protein [Carboxylicivirga mesophila]|uniref:DUF3857 domain-containing transglutaminase family protein n=1 Tax=Carboxylicivirga mesophila TaxID=1166478 RepID=A0ABS5K799_9BACT|nr:DUF3857 domain-containing transglutaminase family protein [Carboxylicivirga mesophila]MBS2210792.1 DUF3857 domain-containing transglutaminase family protein [Carboxylicivirga mesophila]